MMRLDLKNIFRVTFPLLFMLLAGSWQSQTCSNCTQNIETDTYSDIYVSSGNTLCIESGVTCYGNVHLTGGAICNQGTIMHLVLNEAFDETVLNNYGNVYSQETYIGFYTTASIINNSGGRIEFSEGITFDDFSGMSSITIVNNPGGIVSFLGDFTEMFVGLTIVNGSTVTSTTEPAVFNLGSLNSVVSAINIQNHANGILNINGSASFSEDMGGSFITNNGLFNVTSAFNVLGVTLNISNSNQFNVGSNMDIKNTTSEFVLTNNSRNDGVSVNLNVEGDLFIAGANIGITNNDQISANNIRLTSGAITNNKNLYAINNFTSLGGSFSNNGKTVVINFKNTATGQLNNLGYLKAKEEFVNNSTVTIGQGAILSVGNYTNGSNGKITGPVLSSINATNFALYAKVIITGNSVNTSTLQNNILVNDESLNCSGSNNQLGFDNVSNPQLIGEGVSFANTCNNSTVLVNCLSLPALCKLIPAVPNGTFCPNPEGNPATLSANLYSWLSNSVVTFSTPVTSSYTWQPGNLTGQIQNVHPLVTTVYTVYASYMGCIISETILVNICPFILPAIAYSPAAFLPTSNVSFTPVITGTNSGVFSISPTNPSITINANTGIVSATGNCFGTYTISFVVSNLPCNCETTSASTVITLENLSCSISMPTNSFALCPDDKVLFEPTINYGGTYTQVNGGSSGGGQSENSNYSLWAPASGTFGAGLSCTSCANPTLIFNGTATIYTLTAYRNGQVCGTATVDVKLKEFCEKEEIIGCCFSNYGAAVYISQSTYLNVYCNLLNELGYSTGAGTGTVVLKGRFNNNDASNRVLLDWIHNAKNDLYTAQSGTTSLFGFDQKVKGNSNTHFNELWLNGNGTKSIWTDEYTHANLDFTSNILDLRNNTFFMKEKTATVIRTSGYANNNLYGYFSWYLANAAQVTSQKYLYPTGSTASVNNPFRYRPIVMANNSTSQNEEISVNFMNTAPSVTTDPAFINSNPSLSNNTNNQAPNVLQINHSYYHKVKNTISTNTLSSDISIKSYYVPSDGQYQSLSEWEKDPNQTLDWWGGTPGSSASTVISSDAGTSGMLYAMANGTFNFNHSPFALSRGGFYVNTSSFGNTNNNNGTTITLTATPLGGGSNTPAGGGLNSAFGTGANSGNNGNGDNTVFTPNPVSGEYVMNITPPNTCAIPDKIRFVIDQNGNINSADVKYGLANSPTYLGELSDAVYTIDNVNSGITFSATPKILLRECVNTITITTSNNGDHVYSYSPSETVNVLLPTVSANSSISYGAFKIFNTANTLLYSYSGLTAGNNALVPANQITSSNLTPGVYRFELQLNASTAPPVTEILKGQLIIK